MSGLPLTPPRLVRKRVRGRKEEEENEVNGSQVSGSIKEYQAYGLNLLDGVIQGRWFMICSGNCRIGEPGRVLRGDHEMITRDVDYRIFVPLIVIWISMEAQADCAVC